MEYPTNYTARDKFWDLFMIYYPPPSWEDLSLENKEWEKAILAEGIEFDIDFRAFPKRDFLFFAGASTGKIDGIEDTPDFPILISWANKICREIEEAVRADEERLGEMLQFLDR